MKSLESLATELKSLGHDAVISRDRVWIGGYHVDCIVDGVPLSFTRRRYSAATFTWVDALLTSGWVSLGDPWQCITPSVKDLRREIAARLVPKIEAEPANT